MPAPKPIREASHRVRVFVDFWNYTLLMRGVDPGFQTDWSRLGPVLARAAATVVDEAARGEYQGLNFYGSWNPSRPRDRNLHRWAHDGCGHVPGCQRLDRPSPERTLSSEVPPLLRAGCALSRL